MEFSREFNRYFRLVQSIVALVFHAIALSLFASTFKRVFKSKSGDMSLMLKTFLVLWMIENVLSFPNSIYVPLQWASSDVFTHRYHSWTVIWERGLSCSIPVAVFFLTLDRSLTLFLGLNYRDMHKRIMCVVCVLIIMLATANTLFIYLPPMLRPRQWDSNSTMNGTMNSTTFGSLNGTSIGMFNGTFNGTANGTIGRNSSLYSACRHTVCILDQPDDWQSFVRVTFGTLNVVCSLNFFYLLKRQNAKMVLYTHSAASKNSSNAFVTYALVSELLLNFVPHAGCLLYELIADTNISHTFGTYSRLLTAIDALTCAVMYRRIKKKMPPLSVVIQISSNLTPPAELPRKPTLRSLRVEPPNQKNQWLDESSHAKRQRLRSC